MAKGARHPPLWRALESRVRGNTPARFGPGEKPEIASKAYLSAHKLIATIRSREISACIILQSQAQLKSIYKDNAETIIGNCDAKLFLGGNEKTTLKDWAETLGKETIDTYNNSVTKGNSPSYGQNYQKLGKELMSLDELAVLDGSKCLLQVRGVRPFLSDKYDITKHRNYKYLEDADPKNAFDIAAYVSTKLKMRPGEPYELYELGDLTATS